MDCAQLYRDLQRSSHQLNKWHHLPYFQKRNQEDQAELDAIKYGEQFMRTIHCDQVYNMDKLRYDFSYALVNIYRKYRVTGHVRDCPAARVEVLELVIDSIPNHRFAYFLALNSAWTDQE